MLEKGIPLVGSGSKTALTPEQVKQLALRIGELCTLRFSPTRSQGTDLVQYYVTLHGIKTPFKENRPGKEWLSNFLKRNKLNTKKANMISYARMANTSNPFVVYDFFETIEKIANENNFSPSQVWNCDETGSPADAGQCKVVAPKGKQPNKMASGAGWESISVLAISCADGHVLDPLISFSGINFQSTWRGKNLLPNLLYGIYKNEWMTTEIFAQWFENFVKQILKKHPLFVVYYRHLTHVSLNLIEKAMEEHNDSETPTSRHWQVATVRYLLFWAP